MTALLSSPDAAGLSPAEIYARVRTYQSVIKSPDGSFYSDSGVVWSNNEVDVDGAPKAPVFTPDTSVVSRSLVALLEAVDSDNTTVDVFILVERTGGPDLVGVRHQQALAMIAGSINTFGDLDAIRASIVDEWRRQGDVSLAGLEDQVVEVGGEVTERIPQIATIRATIPASSVRTFAARQDVRRIEPYSKTFDDVGHSMTVEGPVDGLEVADYLQSNPFSFGYQGDPSETIFLTESAGNLVRTDHPSFKNGAGISRVFSCGGTDPFTCVWQTVPAGQNHTTKVAAILGSDLTLGQDNSVSGFVARSQRSGVARHNKIVGISNDFLGRVVFTVVGRSDVFIVNQSAARVTEDPYCLGADVRSVAWNTMYESGVALFNSTGNNGWSNINDCRVGSPGNAIGVFPVNAIRIEDLPTVGETFSPSSSRGGTGSEGAGRTIIGVSSVTGHNLKASALPGGNQYSGETERFGITSASTPTVSGAASVFRHWFRDTYGSLIDDPGILYANLLHMGDGLITLPIQLYQRNGFSSLFGAGRLRLRRFEYDGLDQPAGWETGSVCVGRYEQHIINLNLGDSMPAGVGYIKATTWWYDHDHDDYPGTGHDTYSLALQRNTGTGWTQMQSDTSIDSRQRVWYDGNDLAAGGDLWRVRIHGGAGVTSDNEGCEQNSNRVYYAVSWEDNSRDDDPLMQVFIRPEAEEL